VVLKVGKYHSIFLSLREEVFFGSISIIAHTQLDVGYFEAEACFFKRHNKVLFMTAWEWGVTKEKGASPSPLDGYGQFFRMDMGYGLVVPLL